jgi:hypothetical protein
MHVILTPTRGPDGEISLEVCQIEPVGAERAQDLIDMFAEASMEEGAHGACHSAAGAPCPICSPSQRDLVSEAVRRALWQG